MPVPMRWSAVVPIALGAFVVAGLVVGGVLLFVKNDSRAVADTTSASDETFVITSPIVTTGGPTPADTVADGTVTDDTGFFSVQLPGSFQTDTAPIDANGTRVARVSGSKDLTAYNNGHDTPGVTVLGVAADRLQPPGLLVTLFDPGVDVCTTRVQHSDVSTAFGGAEVVLIDGCGANGASKVVMSVLATGNKTVLVVIVQGPGPASGGLLDFAEAILSTVTPA